MMAISKYVAELSISKLKNRTMNYEPQKALLQTYLKDILLKFITNEK